MGGEATESLGSPIYIFKQDMGTSEQGESDLEGTGPALEGTGLDLEGTGPALEGTGLDLEGTGPGPVAELLKEQAALGSVEQGLDQEVTVLD